MPQEGYLVEDLLLEGLQLCQGDAAGDVDAAPDLFQRGDGGVLLACACETGLAGEITLPNHGETKAFLMTYDDPEPKKADILRVEKDKLIIRLPASEMAVIVIK